MKLRDWLLIVLGLLFTYGWIFVPIGQAKLKTFYKGYPWGINDTTSDWAQREIAWERSKGFSFCLEGGADIPGAVRLFYDRPRIIMYRVDGDSEWFNAWAIARPGKIDSMYAWIGREGYSLDSCFLHWDSTRVISSGFLEAWSSANDTNSDGVRDYTPEMGLVTSYGVNYFIDTLQSWTDDEWQGWGVYSLIGDFIDTVDSNTENTIWYNKADTTNLLLNPDFESGDSNTTPDSWTNYASRETIWTVTWEQSCSLRSCMIAPDDTVDWIYLVQKVTGLTDNEVIKFRLQVKANSTRFRVILRPGNNINEAGLLDYYIPSDSADNSWHYYEWTLTNHYTDPSYIEDSIWVTFGYQAPQLSDTAFVDCITLYELQGVPPTWISTGDFGENITYRPYIIDHLSCSVHTSTAIAESLARCYPEGGAFQYQVERLGNVGYTGYQYFQKWWSAKVFDIRSAFGFDGIFMDEMWGYTPIPGRNWTVEYGTDQAQYQTDAITVNGMVRDTLSSLGYYTFINVQPDTIWAENVDGILVEGQDNPQYSCIASSLDTLYGGYNNYPFTGYQNNLWRYSALRDKGKIVLYYSAWNPFEQTVGAEAITRYDTIGQMGRNSQYLAQYENTFAGRNRARMSSLAYYYLIASDSTYYWYEIDKGYLSREYYGLWETDIGDPDDTAFEFASGVDDSGFAYVVAGRYYDDSTYLVLYKPKSYMSDWWGCYTSPPCSLTAKGGYYNTTDTTSWDNYPATTHDLGGSWLKFNWKGETDGLVQQISLRFNEGVILYKCVCE